MNQYTKAYTQGYDAYNAHSDTNPYDGWDLNRADWWESGWQAAASGVKNFYAGEKQKKVKAS